MKRKMKRNINKLRLVLISALLKEDEHYLLKMAIQDRTDKLYKLAVSDPDSDYDNCKSDINTLWAISTSLKKTDWR